MKKRILLGACILTLGLSACSSEEPDVDTLLEQFEEDKIDLGITNEWDGINYTNLSNQYGETTEGFYYCGRGNNTMMYISKKAAMAMPLCTKAECIHDTDATGSYTEGEEYSYKCNAAYYNSSIIVQVYNGKLYADTQYIADNRQALLSCELDGTEVLRNLNVRIEEEQEKAEQNNYKLTASSVKWCIANDKVYVASEAHLIKRSLNMDVLYVDIYDLKSGELIKELFYNEYETYDMMPGYIYVADDNVYLVNYMFYQDKGDTQNLVQINEETGEYHEVEFGADRDYKGYNYIEGKIIFGKNGGDVYTLDVYDNEVKVIELEESEREIGMYYGMVGDYIFLTTRQLVELEDGTKAYYTKIYDSDYNYIDTMYHSYNIIAAAGGTNVILFTGRGNNNFYYINADEIGTGNIELKTIEMYTATTGD